MEAPFAVDPPTSFGMVPNPLPPSPIPQQWYEQPDQGKQESINLRSVTPAMNNIRGAQPPLGNEPSPVPTAATDSAAVNPANASPYAQRSETPNGRYYGSLNGPSAGGGAAPEAAPQPPSSTGLIRLTLRKPMGIVFEPMYDPNNPSVQRGVRICDLPRTGAAALSRKLEVGDELLSINDKTMSRLTFDEIMDFIIEADPEQVNLLFRRPRKEALHVRQGPKAAPANSTTVKWVDDGEQRDKKKDKKRSDKKVSKRTKKEEEDTVLSEEESRAQAKKKGRRKDPVEHESFLDVLIDTICANPDNVCKDKRRTEEDFSDEEDDGTFASRDDSTYITYESEDRAKKRVKDRAAEKHRGEETDEGSDEDKKKRKVKKEQKEPPRPSPPKEPKAPIKAPVVEKVRATTDKYEDDTLESVNSTERPPQKLAEPPAPLGLSPKPDPVSTALPSDTEDDGNPAPVREVEYDERIDHGADVSVMESLGGPSLLIEKQRQAVITAKVKPLEPVVPADIVNNYGKDYPANFGSTREQTIQKDPLKFYTHVVRGLLQENEPEKVRLLDKLLAKYKGREDHLVQKLSVRYTRAETAPSAIPEEEEEEDRAAFTDAVKKSKESAAVAAAVNTAKQRVQSTEEEEEEFDNGHWPAKETKEPDEEEDRVPSENESEYSGDSIDGTSPAVIAQVSELLNYVYGKTSVPGQIDRVSTIMRAYEGREAVLLELLETKALIKANAEKENAANLPSFLRHSPALQHNIDSENIEGTEISPVTPLPSQPQGVGGTLIHDDISSMSGVSSPADGQQGINAVNPAAVRE